ncbi:MAG TPA: FAD-linked oxidase C-terminal domain-containing protein, partial [Actinomycetota bacterium]|nr:FAD-linked oxidase C-terminal domain-containing protein [Actinomycetota bacterium]
MTPYFRQHRPPALVATLPPIVDHGALAGTPRTVVGAFPDLVSSGQAVAQITRRGLTPAVLELLDRACLEAVEEWKHLGIDADAAA